MVFAAFLALARLQTAPIPLMDGLTLGKALSAGRVPVPSDLLQASRVQGTFGEPVSGKEVVGVDGQKHAWTKATPNKEGWIESDDLDGGYYFATFDSPKREVRILNAQGQSSTYVNGQLRAGDPYGNGEILTPIVLEQGRNEFYFICGRGRIKATLDPVVKPAFFNSNDLTLPDVSGVGSYLGSIAIVNASEKPLMGLSIRVGRTTSATSAILPLGSIKAAFRFQDSAVKDGQIHIELRQNGETLDSFDAKIATRKASESRKITFASGLDDSVQYFAAVPALTPSKENALVLSLHGASVEAIGQANSYAPKRWATLVCPTNRRPFGFDWEDWGRFDALETLGVAGAMFPHDSNRVYLTGHSMGGHGSWHLSTTFPDRFAAVGPSAGWISFFSYAGGYVPDSPSEAEKVLVRATNASQTLNQVRNLKQMSVYAIHGDKDDNVPVTEARTMVAELRKFHDRVSYHEEPGAGHWWSTGPGPGAACVDWPALFDLFGSTRIPNASEIRTIEFHTASPSVSARDHWLTVLQQDVQFAPSTVKLDQNPNLRTFEGTTENVAALEIDVDAAMGSGAATIAIDGKKLENLKSQSGKLTLRKGKDGWAQIDALGPEEKRPARGSGLKNALRHHWAIVYGTHGSDAENAWMLSTARLYAETYRYRGNASVPTLSDEEVAANPARIKGDVLVIGSRDTNRAWNRFLGDHSPIDAYRGGVLIGSTEYPGQDLVGLFCRPMAGSQSSMAVFVGATGEAGRRLAERLPIFTSGVAYPDYAVFAASGFEKGSKATLAAGFFGNRWELETGL